MFHSQNFLAQERHLHKTYTPNTEEYFTALREIMDRHLRQFPESLVTDLLDHAVANSEDAEQLVTRIADTIDLLWMQYDDQNDPFTQNDWHFVRELVDAYAVELEMPLVQYIMERVVEHDALG